MGPVDGSVAQWSVVKSLKVRPFLSSSNHTRVSFKKINFGFLLSIVFSVSFCSFFFLDIPFCLRYIYNLECSTVTARIKREGNQLYR